MYMGLGLLLLVSVGKENLYLSAQPEITFFKIAYKRHTNYSIEPTPQYFKTTPDFGRRCTINIGKNADLLGKSYLYVELPNIQMETFQSSASTIKKFAWVKKIGCALINFVEVEIGGSIVDRHYGDWINIWNEMTISLGHKKSYNKMIGNIQELIEYSETKKSTVLYIPFSFWFCEDTGLGIPLIALANTDIKIHVEFNDIDLCYKISPSYFINVTNNYCIYKPREKFYQNNQNNKIIGEFIYFDPIEQKLYYNPIKGKFNIPTILNDPKYKLIGTQSNFIVNIKSESVVVKDEDYFKFNKPSLISAYLLVNYIYLDNFERYNFINNSHEYLIPLVQTISEQLVYSTNSNYKLPLINPVKLLVWRAILLSNISNNNQFDYTTIPFTETPEFIINKNLLVINSINRMELDSYIYYTILQKYQSNFYNNQEGIYMYSFSLNPKELQPSGSINFSKIDDAYIQLTMNNIINYQNPASIRGYAIEYNLLRVSNGIGGLGFNN
jgi:hypothetical protein